MLREAGIPCEIVFKIHEGRPNPIDLMKNGEISLILLTSTGDELDLLDGKELRRLALGLDVPTVTTLAGCYATVAALRAIRSGPLVQTPIQDYFRECGCLAWAEGAAGVGRRAQDAGERLAACDGHSLCSVIVSLWILRRAAGYKDDSLDIILQ